MIRLEALSKRYGDTRAVDSLDLTVSPGRVTGFLGPNGAGKSTTMRMILGLDTPTEGAALVDGRPYADWPAPLTKVGALLDAKALHPRRTARNHLVAMAQSNGIPVSRVDEVLSIVGLDPVARKRAGQFSLGLVVIGRGRLIADAPVAEVIAGSSQTTVVVRVPDRADLAVLRDRLTGDSERVESADDRLIVTGVPAERVGDLAHEHGVRLHELHTQRASREEAYMELTADSVQYGVAAAS